MSTGMKVSKGVMDKVADYLKAATLDTGSVSRSVYNIAKDLGMASATVDRAIRALRAVGVITILPPRVWGTPQTVRFTGQSSDDPERVFRVQIDRIKIELSALEHMASERAAS